MKWILLVLAIVSNASYALSINSLALPFKGSVKWLKQYPSGVKAIKLSKSLGFTKSQNIKGILNKAVSENHVDAAKIPYLEKSYKNLPLGDQDLLYCLRSNICDPMDFHKLIDDLPSSSSIYRKLAYKHPTKNLQNLQKFAGSINEKVMSDFYTKSGWKQLEGEIGNNGIDGLFVKVKDGVVRDVLVVEAKYNKSQLGNPASGMQMSKTWIQGHIDSLIKHYPDKPEYNQIKRFVDNDTYRGVLWKMNEADERLIIDTQKVLSKGSDIQLVDEAADGLLHLKKIINLKFPTNGFDKGIVDSYINALEKTS